MNKNSEIKQTIRSHDSISTETRRALVELVVSKGMSVRKASKLLLLNYTTGKALMTKYRRSGCIDRVNKLKKIEANSQRIQRRDVVLD